jgi:MFS family permease
MRVYLTLFSHAGVFRLVMVAVVSRLAAPMVSLSLLLSVQSAYGSFASGGLVLTGYAAALAVLAPFSGRLVDRFHPRPVLLGCLAVHVAAYALMITTLLSRAPVPLLIVGALLLGASTPPAGPVVRSSWAKVVPAERLQTAFALDAVLNESMIVTGPLIVSLVLLIASPVVALFVAAGAMVAGVLLLVLTPAADRQVAEDKPRARRALGPLAHGQVRILLGIMACDTVAYGSMVVAIAAAATSTGNLGFSGVLLSILSLGAVISGLVYGTRDRSDRATRQLAMFHAASCVLLVCAALATPLWLTGALLVLVGLVGGPRDTLHQLVLSDAAPEGHRTEVFAWLSTFSWAGYGLGTAISGQLVALDDGRPHLTFVLAAVAAGSAAGLSLLVRPTISARTQAA